MPIALWPLIKEALFDKGTLFAYTSRNKLATALFISHVLLMIGLLFMTDQSIQKQALLSEAKVKYLDMQKRIVELDTCLADISIVRRDYTKLNLDYDYLRSDYKMISSTPASVCKPQPNNAKAVAKSPAKPKQPQPPKRDIKAVPNKRRDDVADYQSMLEGL